VLPPDALPRPAQDPEKRLRGDVRLGSSPARVVPSRLFLLALVRPPAAIARAGQDAERGLVVHLARRRRGRRGGRAARLGERPHRAMVRGPPHAAARGFEQVAVSLVVKRRRRRLVRGRGRGRARRRRRARAAVRASPADAIAEVVEHPEQRVSRVAHVSRAARRAAPRRPSTHASRRALEEVERRPARRERGRALHAARARVPELVQLQGVPCALFGGAGAAVFVRRVGNISARRPRSRGHAEEFEARRAAMRARDDRSLRARGAVDRRARQSMRFSHRSRSISRSSDRRDATRGAIVRGGARGSFDFRIGAPAASHGSF